MQLGKSGIAAFDGCYVQVKTIVKSTVRLLSSGDVKYEELECK